MKTLLRRNSILVDTEFQLAALNTHSKVVSELPRFRDKLRQAGMASFRANRVDTLQINLGKLCNQTCKHCHVDAGPDRTEIMTAETMEQCLKAIALAPSIETIDLTGGAPEMNPQFRWFVSELTRLGRKSIVRCNLTILLAGEKYADLPQFFSRHRVHVVSSLPHYDKAGTDRQRGLGVFDKSIEALRRLNREGYGIEGSGLQLDLIYNPNGAFLPAAQAGLESDFKIELRRLFDIEFNRLYAITNLPVSRFLDYLVESENLEGYMSKLVQAFNVGAAEGVMCRNLVSVGWDGQLYDCDFNQMLQLPVSLTGFRHIRDFSMAPLASREIVSNQHCYGCTAGQGSSCGGSTV